jgi:predicted 3-demethylubiquinone-9 3-methyltransferase (glyoxalase superfamily)
MAKEINPFLMFASGAEAAMNFYLSLFPGSHIETLVHYDATGPGVAGSVKQAALVLNGRKLEFFDSPVRHAFTFTPAISFAVACEDADEVDRLFTGLSEGGQVLMGLDAYPFAKRFGWVNDKFGVSWQLHLT